MNIKGEQADCHLGPSLPRDREAGVQQPELKARDCCNLSPTDRIFHQTVSRLPAANHVFLGSWMVHIGQECHSLRSAPRGDTQHTWNCAHMPGKLSGQDQGGTYSAWPTRDSAQAPGRLRGLDLGLGRAQNSQPIWVCALSEHPRT